jgi:hypothetical protein
LPSAHGGAIASHDSLQIRENLLFFFQAGKIFAILAIAIWHVSKASRWARASGVAGWRREDSGCAPIATISVQLRQTFCSWHGRRWDYWDRRVSIRIEPLSASETFPLAPPIPGDGTNKVLNRLTGLIGLLGYLAHIAWWVPWTHRQGIPITKGLPLVVELLAIRPAVTLIHELGHAAGVWE